jgi:t-SNARE complex subunit (syntaxin)
LAERHQEVAELQKDMLEVNQIFKDVANLAEE